ncbi:uncharacterized protein F4812DRAFT_471490 [Daldinia caldariorum]|uniref:uncharacterized protein n=1 Tax=Daldinia caldariorum TaxID=326644 RepID=UPI002007625C|nr:uncharacterized protein F4812DRAFT_471490 [Daldinia caldariorum]KAI1467426.1 hypothetical protein F4812DRAFT_471490 [Daldinia caldariorum]
MYPPPRTPSPKPESPLEIPSYITQLRALSLDDNDEEFDHGNLEPASPASRALLSRHYEGIRIRGDNSPHRHEELSPFDSPTATSGNSSAFPGCLEQEQTGSTYPFSFIPTIRITSPASPSPPKRGGSRRSHLNSILPYNNSMDARNEDPARRVLENEFYDLESVDSATGHTHSLNNPLGTQIPGRDTSQEHTRSFTENRNVRLYGDAKIRHDNPSGNESVARSKEWSKGGQSPVRQEQLNERTEKISPSPGNGGFVNYKYPRYPPLVHPLRAHPVSLPPGAPPQHSARDEDEPK